MSEDDVYPIRGSTLRGVSCSYSSTHSPVPALPDCMAVFAGLNIRAVILQIPFVANMPS